ncbi:recombination protein RecR [Candidatus Roizmanbacteria bacterium RIFCSPHIGHO2_02_FULL_40_13b]|uniref:Recombination protein RecR n=1 Tax=Candidatus Roizmanbacteria bacterium RIFCSPHIGHO2_01_FULL_39_24 TaxID=1802032 RepID=A0A1F7GEG1_9BACT|nr:MAG: recombination protein RecR [Candidatus Roizmanbacteria bacterium RIFCSPHIGHO2_01_FULL_39_24]OGK26217.1 MAG: recombination protein RecR [Candidatus Roizmanbacteria bacterium RIFCSPHIGHO2_02_FULL_40_13b]OGK50369.1 MAG: recombination protein RecR [Candidatus Roizmanbacteria bacterium RIFCSPLOWO2_01_FULL_40_32]OGK56213.1 MAG: recombination protein RecR [Candidatus Roizmanbacteria bacterium RIFCSPLOWO2_02_FULL_39_8]
MNKLPASLQKAIDFFDKLPSIGGKTARRLGFYLLRIPQSDLEEFAAILLELKKKSHYCKICMNLTEEEICAICTDSSRDSTMITVVEDVIDLLSMDAGNQYNGVYHVLHGRIDPLNYIGPEEIYIQQLLTRIKEDKNTIKEVILATNPNTEGEATALYIKKLILEVAPELRISRLAYGLPIGADLEYADYLTLQRAMEGRRDL